MAYAPDELKPIKPRTLGEIRRLAHALMYPRDLNGKHYVIMSRFSPMHFVAGVFEARKKDDNEELEKANQRALNEAVAAMAAERIERGGVVRDLIDPYNKGKEKPFRIYEVEKTGAQKLMDWIEPCWHDDFTEWWCPWMFGEIDGLKGLKEEMVDHFELTIVLNDNRGQRPHKIVLNNIPSNTDLITLRREALERFVYPQYATSVDSEYARTLQSRLAVCHPNRNE